MPAKTDEIVRFSRQLVQSVKDGNTNPLELLVMLRSLEAVSEMVREDIEENILKEADKYSEKVIQQYGARIEKKDVGVKYAYASSQDVQWEQLDSQIAGLSLRKRQREEFLRTLKEPLTVVDEETGEVTKIHPPHRTSKTGVAVYLK
jgi:hypothetical protein